MAGLGAARMVAKPLADQLIKKGIGKQVNKGVGRPISKVDDLPATAQKMFKSPKAVADQKSSVKFAEAAAKRRSAGAKKAAATRAAKPKTPEQIEATKINKALARGRKKTKEQRDDPVPDKLDPDKFDEMMKMMDVKDQLARQAITGKRKAGGKVKGDKLEEGKKPKKRLTPKRKKRKPFEPFVTMEAKGGGKVKGYKKGGAITYRMTGGQVVDNSYD